jgi:alkanesulfonate monooxygenase SsuD/methylene tetrahydromethanopterin reductase-like flavin-dependent oxidoreductase (luciferase family)
VTLRVVAEHADVWHTYVSGDQLRRKSEVLARWCAEIGRDPATIERATAVYGGLDPRLADDLVELGVSLFVIEYTRPPYDFSDLSTWLRWRADRNGQA